MSPGSKKIGLLDHMGGGNLGDDSTQTAVMSNIRARWRNVEICAFSMNPEDSQSRHSILSYPIRRNWWKNPDRYDGSVSGIARDSEPVAGDENRLSPLIRRLRSIVTRKPVEVFSEFVFVVKSFGVIRRFDILVISGGGQLLDAWGGPWGFPYTIFKWVSLARLAGAKCYFLNVGAGPLQHVISKFFVRHALRFADYVSFRDEVSMALAREVGFAGTAHVLADCVYALNVPCVGADRPGPRNEPLVGLSPMAYRDPRRYWIQDQNAYEAFTRKFALFGSWLSRNYRVTLFSTDIWFDARTLEEVDTVMKEEADTVEPHVLSSEPIKTLETLLSQLSSMDYIVTCRFHGVVFAHLMNIPVIALSHHPKVATLMADLGLSEYCLDIDTFDLERLKSAFTRMVADKDGIKIRMAEKAALFKSELTRQFDQLFPVELAR